MPTLRRGARDTRIAAKPGRPKILLESDSPYASRRLVVEYDGTTTAAYLHDRPTAIAATWSATHDQAPPVTDMTRLTTGKAPVMPAEHTKHPGGRPVPEPQALRARWLEEGDGVAILENGELLAVIPGWSDMSKGMPGYCRDIIGQTPFGWSIDDAMEGLGPRVEQAIRFWRWRGDEQEGPRFQQAVLGHLLGRLGRGAGYWGVGGGKQPLVGVSERPPAGYRHYTVLSTVGMCTQRVPAGEQLVDDVRSRARIELAIATTPRRTTSARILLWL